VVQPLWDLIGGGVIPALQGIEDPFRDNFWNIPEYAKVVMYVTIAMATLALFFGLLRRFNLYTQGQPLVAWNHLPQRAGRFFVYVFGQLRLARQSFAGLMHLLIFWAFLVLFLGTTLVFIEADITEPMGIKYLQDRFYLLFEFSLDTFGLFFLVGLAMGWYRRYVKGSVKLSYDWGWSFMLGILIIINAGGFIVEALRLAVAQPWWQGYAPVGYALSQLILAFGWSNETLRNLHLFGWLTHVGFVALFIGGIPYTPLMHIFTSPLNIFFSRIEDNPRMERTLRPIPDIEAQEVWGVGALEQFTWKQLLDFDACTECGRCQAACPAWNAGTALNPKHLIIDLRNQMLAEGKVPYAQIGGFENGYKGVELGAPLVGGVIRDETLWACTTCRACVYECPVFIEHIDSIVDMRRYLVMTEGRIPDTTTQTLKNIEKSGNPWGYPADSRMDWAKGLDVPVARQEQEVEYIYWVGCASSFDDRNQKIARSVVQLLNKAGVNYAVLGQAESCNGDPARRLGNEYVFQLLAEKTIDTLNKHSFKKVITSCPHCFNTIGNEYKPFGGDYVTVHHTEVFAELIKDGVLKPTQAINETITYHDPCYLGRYNDVYDAPREVLAAIPGIQLIEMPRSREKSLCCGGGGGGVFNEVHGERRINELRLEEAQGTGAGKLAAACPFCTIMFDSGTKTLAGAEEFGIEDVSELLLRSVE
jgi:Fe-S oxidoreductase